MSEDAQAAVSVVAGLDAARARLSEILRAEGARSVVVSPAAAGEPWAVLPAVEADGRHALRRALARPRAATCSRPTPASPWRRSQSPTRARCALVASPGDHRLDSLLPPVHVALVRAGTLVPDLSAAIARLDAARNPIDHSAIVFVRGPSRTADIELTLTVGVHGPGRAHIDTRH